VGMVGVREVAVREVAVRSVPVWAVVMSCTLQATC
jgi:hypothetical protein